MSLITFNQRMKLWDHLRYKLSRYYTENKGTFTFKEFLDFREKLYSEAVSRHSTEKYKNRIPQYIWQKYYGASEIIFQLIEGDVEGGYMVFGQYYRHPGRNTAFPEVKSWQDICPEDPAFRQSLLLNYVTVWKSTRLVYSEKLVSDPEKPYLCFYETRNAGYFKFTIKGIGEDQEFSGSEPCSGQADKYRKVLEIMKNHGIPMKNVEEL